MKYDKVHSITAPNKEEAKNKLYDRICCTFTKNSINRIKILKIEETDNKEFLIHWRWNGKTPKVKEPKLYQITIKKIKNMYNTKKVVEK